VCKYLLPCLLASVQVALRKKNFCTFIIPAHSLSLSLSFSLFLSLSLSLSLSLWIWICVDAAGLYCVYRNTPTGAATLEDYAV
jgi:hypothetical protein